MNAQCEQLKTYIGELLNVEPPTDTELQNFAINAPASFHLVAEEARGVGRSATIDCFLRGLPDDLLASLVRAMTDFLEWATMDDPASWNDNHVEVLFLTGRFYLSETGGADATAEEMTEAALNLSQLVFIEWDRRQGWYSWVDKYVLSRKAGPQRIAARWSGTEH